jgi:hypothetical protein
LILNEKREVFGDNETFFNVNEGWMTKTRAAIRNLYVKRAADEGTTLVDRTEEFSREQLHVMCSILFTGFEGDKPFGTSASKNIHDHSILLTDFYVLGRISEVGKIRYRNFYYDHHTQVFKSANT